MKYIKEMLEFNKIISQLKTYAITEKAKIRFNQLEPILNEVELENKLNDTTAARDLLDRQGNPPIASVDGIKKIIEDIDKGQLLSIEQIESVRQFTVLSMRLLKYLNKNQDLQNHIVDYGKGIQPLESIKIEIERCIHNSQIDDYASSELKNVRRKISSIETNIKLKLESVLKSKKEFFSDYFISNRNGHYTLPVKKEYKFQISGSVIDTSSSGATLFIEPSSVSKLKDELVELKIKENNEERKILYLLMEAIAAFRNEILLNLDYIEELDYIFAKAKLSYDMKGICPTFNKERKVTIINGRHPILQVEECVPLNISFGEEIRGVVITGPNTGGKTVALKTIGLFSVMAQCGLHIPCESANICMNSHILCDIGDGQSIAQNLSTFSAHIKNIIHIINEVDKESLVLMDELGSGTDPLEGMGIAVAILEELRKSGCNFIATTHYPEVKIFAEQTPSIINACMTFDKESLKPLYSLEIGVAGESCALYIAKKLGMSEEILKNAYQATYLKQNFTPDIDNLSLSGQVSIKEDKEKKIIEKPLPKQKNYYVNNFEIGDSVLVYPEKKVGIVFQRADNKGNVGVQIKKKKIFVNNKRLKIKALAKDLYPQDYDFSIIFDSVENRKARHLMEKKHIDGNEIKYD